MLPFTLFDEVPPQFVKGEEAKNLVKLIFSDLPASGDLLSTKSLKAFLFKKNDTLLGEMREALQDVLTHLHEDKDDHSATVENYDSTLDLKKALIGHVLSIYAFTEPKQGETLNIPVEINGVWSSVEYKVEKIRLTAPALSEPYYAYGLVPVDKNIAAPSKLLFMGTYPIPTAGGSRITKWIDLVPGRSAGELMYDFSKEKLQNWINRQYEERGMPVDSIGQSLGGSLSLISHIEQPDKVNSEAYAPPALLQHLSKRYKKNLQQCGGKSGSVNIYTQKKDLVFDFGTWLPESANIFRITPNENSPVNRLFNHMKPYIAAMPARIERVDPKTVNGTAKRWLYTVIWQTLAVPYFIFNMLYMGLKAAVYPLNRLMEKITNDPLSSQYDASKKQKPWQKVLGGIYDVVGRIITFPLLILELSLTLALTAVAFATLGTFAIGRKLVRAIASAIRQEKQAQTSTTHDIENQRANTIEVLKPLLDSGKQRQVQSVVFSKNIDIIWHRNEEKGCAEQVIEVLEKGYIEQQSHASKHNRGTARIIANQIVQQKQHFSQNPGALHDFLQQEHAKLDKTTSAGFKRFLEVCISKVDEVIKHQSQPHLASGNRQNNPR